MYCIGCWRIGAGSRSDVPQFWAAFRFKPSPVASFYTGNLIPAWKGSLINGALKFALLSRLELKDNKAVKEERLLQDLHERIRDVRQGPDGALYMLTDNPSGRVLCLAPAR